MIWVYLALGVLCEVSAATLLRISDGFTKVGPTLGALALYGLSLLIVAVVVRRLDLGVTYAIWAGSGTVLIAVVGIVFFQEPATIVRSLSIALVVIGIVGLRLSV